MASISRGPNGRRVLQFVAADGRRKTIRLGRMAPRAAEEVWLKVEHLVAAATAGTALDNETARWVAGLGAGLAAKLAAVGLIRPRASTSLGEFLDGFIAGRPDVKKGTRTNYGIARARLLDFFGAGRDLRSITEGDVDAWVVHLRTRYA